jgi:hypothetical protein
MALFERDEIEELLEALADRLASQDQKATVLLVGGAAIAIEYGHRPATRDVDAGISPADVVLAASRALAQERGLPDDWLPASSGPPSTGPTCSSSPRGEWAACSSRFASSAESPAPADPAGTVTAPSAVPVFDIRVYSNVE